MNQQTIPRSQFRQGLQELLRQPGRTLRWPVCLIRRSGGCELLARPLHTDAQETLLLSLTSRLAIPERLPADSVGLLLVGREPERGQALGCVKATDDRLEPIRCLRLVGAGMHVVRLRDAETETEARDQPDLIALHKAWEQERWSRTQGALGQEAWQRLTVLRCAIVGVGRTGSALALALARVGVRSLTLLDPDCIERGNLGEMQGASEADVGRRKVDVVAEALRALSLPNLEVVPVPTSITRLAALSAVQSCDLLFGCADHDSARLATSMIGLLFLKPVLDMATGVHGMGSERRIGADVRLLLPGRCILCCGGLRDANGAQQALHSADAERAVYAQRNWQRERAGSLASLNTLAVGLAERMCEDLVTEQIEESLWAHLEYQGGRLNIVYPVTAPPVGGCPLCRLSGDGEAGLNQIADRLRTALR